MEKTLVSCKKKIQWIHGWFPAAMLTTDFHQVSQVFPDAGCEAPPDIAPPIEWSHLQFLQQWPSWELPCRRVIWFGSPSRDHYSRRIQQQALHHPSFVSRPGRPTGSLLTSQDTQQAKGQHLLRKHYAHLWVKVMKLDETSVSNSGATWSLVATMKHWT